MRFPVIPPKSIVMASKRYCITGYSGKPRTAGVFATHSHSFGKTAAGQYAMKKEPGHATSGFGALITTTQVFKGATALRECRRFDTAPTEPLSF